MHFFLLKTLKPLGKDDGCKGLVGHQGAICNAQFNSTLLFYCITPEASRKTKRKVKESPQEKEMNNN